jgi:tetratricopeptide (TPR) repeat protein
MMNEASLLLKAEKYDRARTALLKILEDRDGINHEAVIEWVLGGLESTWLFQDQFEEQITFFTDYVSRYPSDAAAYQARGAALWYLGRLDEAIRDYSRAMDLNPMSILTRCGRGQILAEVGQSQEAMEDLDVALRLLESAPSPNDSHREWKKDAEAITRNGRAVALAGLGRIREAMTEFETSVSLCADNAWVYYNRARVYERVNDQQRALADYRTSLVKTGPQLSPRQKELARAKIQAERNR